MKRIVPLLVLAALALAAPGASAQSDLGFKRAGFNFGYVDPEGLSGTFGLGGFIDHGTFAPNVALESHLEYWGTSEEAFGAKVSLRDVSLGSRVKYMFPVQNTKIRPFAGAGIGIHFLHFELSEFTFPGQPPMSVEASETKLGLDIGGGIATDLSPRMDLLAETWFGMVDTANTFTLRAGLSFKLGS